MFSEFFCQLCINDNLKKNGFYFPFACDIFKALMQNHICSRNLLHCPCDFAILIACSTYSDVVV